MKVLIISNEFDKPNRLGNPIIGRIIRSLESNPVVERVDFCPFKNRLSIFSDVRDAAKKVDIIHIQFGGLYSFFTWFCLIGIRKPKLITFHGTDIHAKEMLTSNSLLVKLKIWLGQKSSFCSFFLFDKLGFVCDMLLEYVPKWILKQKGGKVFIQPLGVDYQLFVPEEKCVACQKLDLPIDKYVLFSDLSGDKIKRRDIAESIIKELGHGYKLLIMSRVVPELVPVYLNAADFLLLTSDEEGSPNIIREALSLNKRIYSVNVGDAKLQLQGLVNSKIISRDPKIAARQILDNLEISYTDNTRILLRKYIDFSEIANSMIEIYSNLLKR